MLMGDERRVKRVQTREQGPPSAPAEFSKVAFSLQLDGHFNQCLPKLSNYGCYHHLTVHKKQK